MWGILVGYRVPRKWVIMTEAQRGHWRPLRQGQKVRSWPGMGCLSMLMLDAVCFPKVVESTVDSALLSGGGGGC